MLSQCTPVYWVIMWPCRWHAFRLKAIAVLLYCSSQPFVRLHPDGSRRDWRMWWWCTVREAWHALGLWYLAFSFISKYVPPLKVCDSVARHDHICILCKLMVLWMLQFFPTAEESMKFYNQKRCVDSKGLHIPSQLVSSHSNDTIYCWIPKAFFLSFSLNSIVDSMRSCDSDMWNTTSRYWKSRKDLPQLGGGIHSPYCSVLYSVFKESIFVHGNDNCSFLLVDFSVV